MTKIKYLTDVDTIDKQVFHFCRILLSFSWFCWSRSVNRRNVWWNATLTDVEPWNYNVCLVLFAIQANCWFAIFWDFKKLTEQTYWVCSSSSVNVLSIFNTYYFNIRWYTKSSCLFSIFSNFQKNQLIKFVESVVHHLLKVLCRYDPL